MKRTRLLLPFFLLTLLLAACGQTPPPTEEPDPAAQPRDYIRECYREGKIL